jgi:hypothetical protein
VRQVTAGGSPRSYCYDANGNQTAEIVDIVRASTTTERRHFTYDAFNRHVIVYLTPTNGTVGTHFIWDRVDNAFWPDQYPLRAGPWAVCEIIGTNDEDRRVLLGGDDGYVRRYRTSALGDFDTTGSDDTATPTTAAINSYVRFAPMEIPGGLQNVVLTEMQAETGSDGTANGTLEWYWMTGTSPVEVNAVAIGSAASTGTFNTTIGYQQPTRLRVRGGSLQLVVRNSTSDQRWSLERIKVWMAAAGRRRPL